MKKLLFTLAALAALTLTGCKAQWGVIYTVAANGDADGKVSITFPNGSFDANGKSALNFVWSNDTTSVLRAVNAMPLELGVRSNDKKTADAALNVATWADDMFGASAASGTYRIRFKGYVKETLTGITFSIDRELTNR